MSRKIAVVEKNKTFRIQQDSDGQECPNCFKMYIMYHWWK